MDAFKLLQTDHRNVAALFEKLEQASGKEKIIVFNQIKTELELHTHIEETIFYPTLEKPEETHDITLEAYEEHDVVKKLLKELSKARTPNDEWEAQAKVLKENVEHHVEEEENELFGKAEQVLSEEDIEDLGDRMQAEKSRKQRGAASKKSGAKKSSGSKKSSGAKKSSTSKKSSGSKRSGGKSKKAAKKGGGTKKSAAKKSRSKKSAKKRRR